MITRTVGPIVKSAYFELCQAKGCTVRIPHGAIVCTDGSRASCYSKSAARECISEFLRRRFISADEQLALLEQIHTSPLEEVNVYPVLMTPSRARSQEAPLQLQTIGTLCAFIDDELATKLDDNDAGGAHTLH